MGRKSGFRRQLLRGLASQLIQHEKVKTTFPKAKECARFTERLITKAKRDDLNARRAVARDIRDREVQRKLFDVLIKRYTSRVGGYTKVFRMPPRQGDNADMAVIKLIS